MISLMLSVVPIVNPAKPIQPMITFLKIINALEKPDVVCQRARHSNNAGNRMPNADRDNAPTSEMNKSKFGIATAIMTANKMYFNHKCYAFFSSPLNSKYILTSKKYDRSAKYIFP